MSLSENASCNVPYNNKKIGKQKDKKMTRLLYEISHRFTNFKNRYSKVLHFLNFAVLLKVIDPFEC